MTIHILTLSNKPDLLPEARASVAAQTRRDFVHHVALDDGSRDWGGLYPPAVYYREMLPLIPPEDYVCWLSDDDLMRPDYLATLAGYLDAHPETAACYGGGVRWAHFPGQADRLLGAYPAIVRFHAALSPRCMIDGSQMLARRWAFDAIALPDGSGNSRLHDAEIMEQIATLYGIEPVWGSYVVDIRTCPQSAHTVCDAAGKVYSADWRRLKAG